MSDTTGSPEVEELDPQDAEEGDEEGEEDAPGAEEGAEEGEEEAPPPAAAAPPPPEAPPNPFAEGPEPAPLFGSVPRLDATPPAAEPPREERGAEVIRLGTAPAQEDDAPNLVLRVFTQAGSKATGESYAGHLRRFLTWCAARAIDPKTMPEDTAARYMEESYPNPVTRNQTGVALRAAFDCCVAHGIPMAKQVVPKVNKPKKEKAKAAAEVGGVVPTRTNGAAAHVEVPTASFSDLTGRESAAQPAPTQRIAAPRAQPAAPNKKPGQVVPSLGQRIRISTRASGSEGLGVPVGTLILVGDFNGADIDGEGRIEAFIANQIRPVYGPFAGERARTYYVDRLDNLGNPIPGGTVYVPIMPAPGEAPRGAAAPPPPAAAPPGASPTGITGDRMLDYIVTEARRREDEANKRIEEIKAAAQQKGMDPTMLMLLINQVKPPPLDVDALVREFKKANPEPRRRRPDPLEEDFDLQAGGRFPGTPSFPGMQPMGGLGGGLDPFGPPTKDPAIEAITQMMKQQNDTLNTLLTSMLTKMNQPAATQQPMDLANLIALAKSLAPAPAPESALGSKVFEALIMKALQPPPPPEKPKSIPETLKEIAALREAADALGGTEEKPPSGAEVLMAMFENAPAIGQAIGTVLAAVPRPPTLGAPGQPQRPAPGQPPAPIPQKTPSAPLPKPAQEAFLRLAKVEGESDAQEIVNDFFLILDAFVKSGAEPWPRAANKLVDDLKKCDTRIEVQNVVTNMFVWSGAKRYLNEANVERITEVIHSNYSGIYAQFTDGQEKVLKDAGEPVEEATEEEVAAEQPDPSTVA